jgi:flagellin-like hook-associated protein FlgL
MRTASGIGNFAITDAEGARNTLEPIEGALDVIAKTRGAIGAGESRINTDSQKLNDLSGEHLRSVLSN